MDYQIAARHFELRCRRMLVDSVAPSSVEDRSNPTVRILLTCGTFAILFTVLILFVICLIKFCPSSLEQNTNNSNRRTATSDSNRKAAVEEVLATFPAFTYGAEKSPPLSQSSSSSSCSFSAMCSICLEEYEVGECLRVLPNCDHVFHRECIDLWLSTRSSSCPICRDQAVVQNNEDAAAGGNCRNGDGGRDGGGRNSGGSGSHPVPFLTMNFGGDLL